MQIIHALAASLSWSLHPMDVKFAFLHGELKSSKNTDTRKLWPNTCSPAKDFSYK